MGSAASKCIYTLLTRTHDGWILLFNCKNCSILKSVSLAFLKKISLVFKERERLVQMSLHQHLTGQMIWKGHACYECQEKLWAWKDGFYLWNGGLAARTPTKAAGRFRGMFLTLLVGAMSELLWNKISSVTPLASGFFAAATQTVEAVHSSLLFPLPAFLPKSTVRDYDDIRSRSFHPEGLVENNFSVFQSFRRWCLGVAT